MTSKPREVMARPSTRAEVGSSSTHRSGGARVHSGRISNDRKRQAQAHLCAMTRIAGGEFAIETLDGRFGQREADTKAGGLLRQAERAEFVELVETGALVGDDEFEPAVIAANCQ